MGIESKSIEFHEKEPKHNTVVVDFLRHGTTKYEENFKTDEEKALLKGKYPKDLTAEGEAEVLATAKIIVDSINPETDIVAFWSSPAWRAQGSEEIIKELLDKKGASVYKDSEISSMRSFDQYDQDFMNDLWAKIAPTGKSAEMMYSRDPEFQIKNDKFESQPEVKERAGRVFEYITRLAKTINLDGKRLRLIGVSHFEFLNPILEDIFGQKLETGQGFKKGEDIRITFDFDYATKEMKVSADFRGEHKDNILFDSESRRFLTKD